MDTKANWTDPIGYRVTFHNGMETREQHLQHAAYLAGKFGGTVTALFRGGRTEILDWL